MPLARPAGSLFRMKTPRLLAALLALSAGPAAADELQLRDKAAITGRILAEKPDLVVVDVGYTVLLVPRKDVIRITRESDPKSAKPVTSSGTRKPAAGSTHTTATVTGTSVRTGLYTLGDGTGAERSVRELVAQIGEAVVQVRTPGGLGSGFFLNEDGFLITNFHVIESETQISIEVYHQRGGQLERALYKQVRIVAMNKFADLALLKVEDKDAPKFKPVPLGDTAVLGQGERVFAVGSPLGLERTVTEGIVSTKTRQMQGSLFLQTTAQINPGNSGGPLFNLRGEVVGVTNMKLTFGEGLGFAIPVDQVKYFLDHRDAYAYDADNPSNAYRYLAPPSRAIKESTGTK